MFVTLCAIPCSWLAVKMQQAGEKDAAAAIEKLGGRVVWARAQPSGPAWVRNVLGDDFNASVVAASLDGDQVTDADLEYFSRIPNSTGWTLVLLQSRVSGCNISRD